MLGKFTRVFGLYAIMTTGSTTAAVACPSGQHEWCTFFGCWCMPNCGGSICHAGEDIVRGTVAHTTGDALAAYIQQSRNDASNGAMPVPAHIRRQLTGYVSEDVLNLARYKIGDNGALNVAHLAFQMGSDHVAAIALIDIIVFRGPTEAEDVALWAHELYHVQQYRDWGLRDFAIRYARRASDVEGPATNFQNGYHTWAASRPNSGTNPDHFTTWRRGVQAGSPEPIIASQCSTPVMTCWMTVPIPIGSSCSCPFGGMWYSGVAQ